MKLIERALVRTSALTAAVLWASVPAWPATTRHVWPDSPAPAPPYADWATAAHVIQDAVDAAEAGDLVLVTNGVYATGGRAVGTNILVNRVAVDKPLQLTSVNGSGATVITGEGGGGRCVSLASGASLTGFTVSRGSVGHEERGGGVYAQSEAAVITDCVLTNNSGYYGGGVSGGTLNHCTLTGNSAAVRGGGVSGGTLNNCTVSGNQAEDGGGGVVGARLFNCSVTGNYARRGGAGGAAGCTLNNCILYGNTVFNGPFEILADDYAGSALNHCYTTPLPTAGVAIFVDVAGGDLRLQANSPCMNAGKNAYASGTTDLDGRPRIVGGTVDMGAYEFQPDVPGQFIAWLHQFSLPTDGSADFADSDTDGHNDWHEWRGQTDPTNALSVLRLFSATLAGDHVTVRWPGVEGVTYFLERSPDLGASPPFTPLATNLSGPTGTHTFTDTNAAASPSGFYRVGVRP